MENDRRETGERGGESWPSAQLTTPKLAKQPLGNRGSGLSHRCLLQALTLPADYRSPRAQARGWWRRR